jgi:pantoate--beta-alanine ligase
LTIVRRLVVDLNIRTVIVGVPTVREADGLAMSSRNRRLGPAERLLATALYRALQVADRLIRSGATDVDQIRAAASAHVPADPLLRLEYLEIISPDNLQPVDRIDGPVRVAGALWVGATRLIDNVESMRTT